MLGQRLVLAGLRLNNDNICQLSQNNAIENVWFSQKILIVGKD